MKELNLTEQEEFWTTKFGASYRKRNDSKPAEMDAIYMKMYGTKRSLMNVEFLEELSMSNMLEVGCNTGNQLQMLHYQGFAKLYGIEINEESANMAKRNCPYANIRQGSVFKMPFPDSYFDIVFTSGVLIHIHPDEIHKGMSEIYRVTKKYIWGLEYYAEEYEEIEYRGNKNKLWKTDFCKLYQSHFPDLKLVKQTSYPYIEGKNIDAMFLLEKTSYSES